MRFLFFTVFLICITLSVGCGQGVVVKRGKSLQTFAFHGTWDKTRNVMYAQFGGNNRLLNGVFNEFFKNPMIGPSVNEKAQITFMVDTVGNVADIHFAKLFEDNQLNVLALQAIEYTSGKWRPAIKDGQKTPEQMTVHLQFYYDWNNQSIEGLMKKAQERFDKNDYEKALKALDEILVYDTYNVQAALLKGKCHVLLDEVSIACTLWSSMNIFKYPEIIALQDSHCK